MDIETWIPSMQIQEPKCISTSKFLHCMVSKPASLSRRLFQIFLPQVVIVVNPLGDHSHLQWFEGRCPAVPAYVASVNIRSNHLPFKLCRGSVQQ